MSAISGSNRPARAAVFEVSAHVEQPVLVSIDQQEPRRPQRGELAHQLGADRAAGAGHHHAAPVDQPAHRFRVQLHALAAQQVLHGEVPDLADLDLPLEHVAQVRQRLDRQLVALERLNDGADLGGLGAGHRHEHLVRVLGRNDPGQIRDRAQHLDAVDTLAHLRPVVVHEADRARIVEVVVPHVADDQLTRVAGAVDEHAALVLDSVELAVRPPHQARAPQQDDQQEAVDDENGPGIGQEVERAPDQQAEHRRTDDHGSDDLLQIPDAGVPPQPLVEPDAPERQTPDDQQDRQGQQERPHVLGRQGEVEPQQEREVVRDRRQQQVDHDDDGAPVAQNHRLHGKALLSLPNA